MCPALRLCAEPGCGELVERGRCRKHDKRRALDRDRSSSRARGYDRRWERARSAFLAGHPTCRHCALDQAVTEAKVVDHIIPHRGDRRLFWEATNWQALCAPCHNRKSAREAGLQPCDHLETAVIFGRRVCVLRGQAQGGGGFESSR